MRTSWKRLPPKGNTLTSWAEAYRITVDEKGYDVSCLYEDVGAGQGVTAEEAKADFLENIRFRISELTEMLEYCATREPKQVNK
jgi:hypothetical protein